ncbi:DUF6714 family protein [Deinococcus yavapaiensis]|uniref:Uncharacterized protein n=1 Tax=Deinococcus yavapaiensis KR-236 TaxID=694435 RepID=A0A318S7L8_9DEIO|nr:DUF6714 family protein [Deinococcus yavapaiensis]PYE54837.1 hypothetical protein DES52_104108 [Deinococcus yavapaiensis KR-236]
MTKDELLAMIRAAFEDVTLGSGVSLREADVIDSYGSLEERKAARALDRKDAWWELPSDDLQNPWPISFLDDAGFAFYLPAYLTDALRSDLQRDSTNIALFALNPSNLVENFGAITPPQAAAIAAFLEYAEEHDPNENIFYSDAWSYWAERSRSLS